MSWELTLRSRVVFTELHPEGIVAFWAPDRLWRVPTPDCFATLHVPDLLGRTEQDEWNLADPTDRRRAYEILIRRGMPQMMIRWLDGGFLVDLWDQLDLPDPVRAAWEPAVRDATRAESSGVFSWHTGEDPRPGRWPDHMARVPAETTTTATTGTAAVPVRPPTLTTGIR